MQSRSLTLALAGLLLAATHLTSFSCFAAVANRGSFTYNDRDFLLNGEPFQIIAGQMDPQRVPPQYWRSRLRMARAMGLNTIFSLIFWNNIEPAQGQFDWSGRNDVAKFFRIAQEEGLHIVLRPGPYICGEHEWAGFPAWLMEIPGMVVRANNEPFLDASKIWLEHLGAELENLMVTRGGPIILAQLENEYGFYDNDKEYLQALADLLRSNFDVPLFTDDGGSVGALEAGSLHGVLAEIDGDPKTGFAARESLTDPTLKGPLMCCEFYVEWIDNWASNYTHRSPTSEKIKSDIESLEWVLQGNNSFSLYMFHGGTNFAFDAGSVSTRVQTTTSYDYGAPLDETGRPTQIYHALRDLISKYVPAGSIPDVPELPPIAKIKDFTLLPTLPLFALKSYANWGQSKSPISMESMGQSYGFILYEHNVTESVRGELRPGDKPRDRVIIYVNQKKVGVIDNIYENPPTIEVTLHKGDVLQLLVENSGRVDLAKELLDQRKGIVGNVTVGGSTLKQWATFPLPVSMPPWKMQSEQAFTGDDTPRFYWGFFTLPRGTGPDQSGDLLLQFPDTIKGQVWVNGENLGRTWIIGPQQDLYIPGCYLRDDGLPNDVVVLDLEPETGKIPRVRSVTTRHWGNNPDPDLVEATSAFDRDMIKQWY